MTDGNDFKAKVTSLLDTPNTTSSYDKDDIEKNKVLCIFAYLSWLVIIPILAAKDSKFAKFHSNQGLVLFLVSLVWGVIYGVLAFILHFIPVLGAILIALLSLVHLVYLALIILGIVNVLNGEAKELPIIGKIRILK